MTWAVYEGEVPIPRALRSILGWRTTAWWRSRCSWVMEWDPYNVARMKHEFGFHNRGVQWGTPMAKWACEESDWIQLMKQMQPRKENVVHHLLLSDEASHEEKDE